MYVVLVDLDLHCQRKKFLAHWGSIFKLLKEIWLCFRRFGRATLSSVLGGLTSRLKTDYRSQNAAHFSFNSISKIFQTDSFYLSVPDKTISHLQTNIPFVI